jgi:hypothetical protein
MRSLQERLESSETGRAVITAFILVTLFAVLSQNQPRSAFQDATAEVSQPYADLFGVTQAWSVFAPNPPRRSYKVQYRISYPDGRVELSSPPTVDGFLANYHVYRWRKWFEIARRSQRGQWRQTAAWLARDEQAAGRRPRRVEIVVLSREVPPPGEQGSGKRRREVVAALDLPAS